jgi:spore coat protein CotF
MVDKKLNAAEQGKLWATYMGNSMASPILHYMLSHVHDQEIAKIVKYALSLAQKYMKDIQDIYDRESYPLPAGFTDDDVNLQAPRLFADELYLHYLKYVGKGGLNIYSIAVTLMTRPDVRDFFLECLNQSARLITRVNEIMIKKGIATPAPVIPYPNQIDFIKKRSYLSGFFGEIRPLHSLEITHLYDNVENNAISKAILIGFSQVAQTEVARSYFLKGKTIAGKHYDIFEKLLREEDLSSSPVLDPLVTTSTIPPFSDKLMIAHKVDMFSMRVRTYGNALAFAARRDLAAKYAGLMLEVGKYAEEGAKVLIDHGWMEQPPQAVSREVLANSKS